MIRRLPLRVRVAVAGALAAATAVAGTAVVAYFVVAHEFQRSVDLELTREVTRLGRTTESAPGPCEFLTAPLCVQEISADGVTGSPLPIGPETQDVASGKRDAFYSDTTYTGYPVRMLTAPLRKGTAVQVAVRSDRIDESLNRIGLALLVAGAIGIVLAAAAGFLVARAGLAPVRALTRTAREVAATRDPRRRIEVVGNDELASLGTSMNVMLAELQEAIESQRRLVSDASHELRTPLTSLRTNIDLLDRFDRLTAKQQVDTVAALRGQAVELTGLITDLTDLARADERRDEPEELRLDLVIGHCVEAAQRHWPAVEFTTDLEETTVDAVPSQIARAVTNLLDNAAKFSPPGGTVRVDLHDKELQVRDHGPGIPPEDLPHVFDRFYRADTARALPGSGLGLAIVSQVAAAHNAVVTAESDGGTVIRLKF